MARTEPNRRLVFAALAVCCAVPMTVIVVLTSILGVALGPSVAVAFGLVAGGLCLAIMAQHLRTSRTSSTSHETSKTSGATSAASSPAPTPTNGASSS